MDFLLLIPIALFSLSLSPFIHTILHELGHLIFGLINKYEFIFFGIGSHIFLKEEGKIKLKKNNFRGAGGYCLMITPKTKDHETPYFWYCFGGILFNLATSIIIILLIIFIPLDEIISLFLIVFIIIGLYLGILNALPLKIDSGTDGCKILSLYKNKQAREYLYTLEIIGIKVLKGTRMKDIPQNLLNIPKNANFNNPIFASIKLVQADKYYDNMEYEKAEETYKSLICNDIKLTNNAKNETLCQILYFEIIKGNKEELAKLMTKKLKKYIKSNYENISKKRLMYAYTVLIEKDVEKSEEIWYDFHDAAEDVLFKSEAETESQMMDYIGEIGIKRGIL